MKDKVDGNLSVVIASDKNGGKKKTKAFWHINKEMLPYKLHFFLFVGGMGAALPFYTPIGINRFRLTASNLAAVYTTQQFTFIVMKPVIGYIADYFNKLKAVIVGLTIIQAICCLFMITIPKVEVPKSETKFHISSNLQTCDLCNRYQEIELISSEHQLNDRFFIQSLICLENIQKSTKYYEVHCAKHNISFPQLTSIKYKIRQTTCNFSNSTNATLSQYTTNTNNAYEKTLMILSSIRGSHNFSILCFHAKEVLSSFLEENLTLRSMEEQCYAVTELESNLLDHRLKLLNDSTVNINCSTNKSNGISANENMQTSPSSTAIFQTYQFWIFAICLISCSICISSIFTMSDTVCYEGIHKCGAHYGNQRAWGAISWGIVAPFAGFLNDYTESYMTAWCLMVLLCSLQIWNLLRMDLVKPDLSQNIRKDLKDVFSCFEFVAFEIGVFLNGMFVGIIWFYLSWFVVLIGGNKLIIGLAHTVQCYFGEIPLMFLSHWLVKKFGHFNIISLALFANGVKFFVYSFTYNPWWILPVECLHGITFGVFYSAMTSYGKLNSKPGTEATTQSVLCTTYEGLGAGVGCVISGMCFDRFGGHKTFFYIALLCALATGINVVFTIILRFKKGKLEVTKTTPEVSDRY